ncbi:MAG: NAD(P)-dependent oxidoreductase [Gaiella sp.]
MTRIAFVGLGTMGLPIARHLVGAGHELVACDVVPERASALGVPVAVSPAEAAADAEIVLASLPSPAAVEEVVLGPAGIGVGAAPGALVVDLSTSPPALARRLAAELPALDVLDAPVSGGPLGAEAATLTVMVGGDAAAFARARPVLTAFGRLIVHVGPHGAGQTAKLCNNLVAGTTMAGLAEACAIAQREGLDATVLYELMCASTGDSRVLRTRFPLPGAAEPHPSDRGFEPLFTVDLIAKDLELALELADADGAEVSAARAALEAFRVAQERGLGALDYSAVFLVADGPPASAAS